MERSVYIALLLITMFISNQSVVANFNQIEVAKCTQEVVESIELITKKLKDPTTIDMEKDKDLFNTVFTELMIRSYKQYDEENTHILNISDENCLIISENFYWNHNLLLHINSTVKNIYFINYKSIIPQDLVLPGKNLIFISEEMQIENKSCISTSPDNGDLTGNIYLYVNRMDLGPLRELFIITNPLNEPGIIKSTNDIDGYYSKYLSLSNDLNRKGGHEPIYHLIEHNSINEKITFCINNIIKDTFPDVILKKTNDVRNRFCYNKIDNYYEIYPPENTPISISIYSFTGKRLFNEQQNGNSYPLFVNLSFLKSGMYIVKIQYNNTIFTDKIII